jgi:hypothetical protein
VVEMVQLNRWWPFLGLSRSFLCVWSPTLSLSWITHERLEKSETGNLPPRNTLNTSETCLVYSSSSGCRPVAWVR